MAVSKPLLAAAHALIVVVVAVAASLLFTQISSVENATMRTLAAVGFVEVIMYSLTACAVRVTSISLLSFTLLPPPSSSFLRSFLHPTA
jgi:hypothetical protein